MTDAPPQLNPRDAAILELVERGTVAKPVSIRAIQLWLASQGLGRPNDRTIKGVIAALRLAGHPIGSSRGGRDESGKLTEPPGYFYARNAREKKRALREYLKQIYTSLRLARAFAKNREHERQLEKIGEQLSLLENQ